MRIAAIALLLASTIPAAAMAQSAADRSDARCIIVLTLASRNPAQKDAAVRGQFYYYGRISARAAAAKLGTVMVGEARTITSPQQLQGELARCTAELTTANAGLRGALQSVDAAARSLVKPGKTPPK